MLDVLKDWRRWNIGERLFAIAVIAAIAVAVPIVYAFEAAAG